MKIRVNELSRHYKICYRHNIKQFYKDSLEIEQINGRLYLVGRPVRGINKNLHVVAILKKRVNT